MYILIEHSGLEDHLRYANKVQQYLEEEYGATVEQIVGGGAPTLTLYSDDLRKLTELSPTDDISVLSFYINNYYENEL